MGKPRLKPFETEEYSALGDFFEEPPPTARKQQPKPPAVVEPEPVVNAPPTPDEVAEVDQRVTSPQDTSRPIEEPRRTKRTQRPSGRSKPSLRIELADDDEVAELEEFVSMLRRAAKSKVSVAILVRNQLVLLRQALPQLTAELRKNPPGRKPANYFQEELAEYEDRWLQIQDKAMRTKSQSE